MLYENATSSVEEARGAKGNIGEKSFEAKVFSLVSSLVGRRYSSGGQLEGF